MTWTLTGSVIDPTGQPVRDAVVAVRPTRLPTRSLAGTIITPVHDRSDTHGRVSIDGLHSLPGHTWRIDVQGSRWTIADPGDGAVVDIGALGALPDAPTPTQVDQLLTAISGVVSVASITVEDGALVMSMTNGTELRTALPTGGAEALAALHDHVVSPTPHPAYDTDLPDLTLLYRSRTV